MKLDKHIKNIGIFTIYLVISLFVFRKVLSTPGFISLRDDWTMPPYSFQYIGQARKMLYAWSSNFMGAGYIRRLGDYPYLFFSILAWIFGFGGAFFTKGILVLTMSLSGYLMFLFLKDFLSNKKACFLGSLMYMFSPMFFNASVSGYFVFLISYALLPLFFSLFIKILNSTKTNFKQVISAGLLLRFIFGQDNFIFIISGLLSLFYIFEIICKRKSVKDIFNDIKKLAPVFVITWALSLPSFFGIVFGLKETSFLVSTGLDSWNVGATPSIFFSFFLDGAGYRYFISAVSRDFFVLWALFGFVLLSLIFASLFFVKKDKYIVFFIFISLINIFLFKGSKEPFDFINNFLFNKINIFRVAFRNAQYFTVLVSLAFAYLLGSTIDGVTERFKLNEKKIDGVLFAHILILIIAFNAPFLTGDLSKNIQSIDFDPIYKDLLLDLEKEGSRVLWLPASQPMAYKNSRTPGLDTFVIGSSQGFITNDGASPFERFFVEDLYFTKDPDSLKYFLALFNIKNIVLRQDFISYHPYFMGVEYWKYDGMWNNDTLSENIESISGIKKTNTEPPIKVYENTFIAPHFYIPEKYVSIDGEYTDLKYVFELKKHPPKTVYSFSNYVGDVFSFPDSVSNNIPEVYYFSSATSGEHSWPECNISPNDSKYKLVRLKELSSVLESKEATNKISNNIWFGSKRVCEIDTYELDDSKRKDLFDSFLKDFANAYNILVENENKDLIKKFTYYFERSYSLLSKRVPDYLNSDEVRNLYKNILLLGNSPNNSLDDITFEYIFKDLKEGKYDLYLNNELGFKVSVFDGEYFKKEEEVSGKDSYFWDSSLEGLSVNGDSDYIIRLAQLDKDNILDTDYKPEDSDLIRFLGTPTEWERLSDYLVSFDYSYGSGDFKVVIEEEIFKKLGTYGQDIYAYFCRRGETSDWGLCTNYLDNVKNYPGLENELLRELDSCSYWEDDTCYRTYKFVTKATSMARNPILYLTPFNGAEGDFRNVDIKNLKMVKIERPEVVLKSFGENRSYNDVEIEYRKVNPSKYIVSVKNASDPFDLVFSESFSDKWVIKGDFIDSGSHKQVNGYANMWTVNPEKESFDLVVEYQTQKVHYIATFTSLGVFISLVGYLVISSFKIKKDEKDQN